MQSLMGLLLLGWIAAGALAVLVLASPDNRRKLAAWLIASARAQEELRQARFQIQESERRHRDLVLKGLNIEAQCFRALQERGNQWELYT